MRKSVSGLNVFFLSTPATWATICRQRFARAVEISGYPKRIPMVLAVRCPNLTPGFAIAGPKRDYK